MPKFRLEEMIVIAQEKRIGTILSLSFAVLTVVISCAAQQSSETPATKRTVESLIAGLKSNRGEDRDAALYELRSDPVAMRDVNVRSALLSLLDRENREAQAGLHMGEGEGFGEYYSDLLATVESVVDWRDARQVCIIVKAGGMPESDVGGDLASRMKMAIPCLLEMSNTKDRDTAIPNLVEALAAARNDLDFSTVQSVKTVIFGALHDQDDSVRILTVDALAKFGDQDMIPALERVAVSDPFRSKVKGYYVRKLAVQAIAAIQKRAGTTK
jgi:hypothetical protein